MLSKKICGTAFTLLLCLSNSAVLQASAPTEKRVPVDHVFAPKGFDTNDSVEIVVSGFLPNLCHRTPRATTTIEGNKIKVEMKSLYYLPSDPFCPEVVVPFIETVNLGLLKKDDYEIVVNEGQDRRVETLLKIDEPSSEHIDDFVYAGVEYVEKREGSRRVLLKGHNPTDCYELDQIKVVSNEVDTLAILPIMKKVREFCPMKMIPFTYKFVVPSRPAMRSDVVLLHVRRMEGRSVNTLFRNR